MQDLACGQPAPGFQHRGHPAGINPAALPGRVLLPVFIEQTPVMTPKP